MDFEELKQDYFHHVSAGPYEKTFGRGPGSDILFHLPVLEYYASRCEHITEFGVRSAFSTVALLSGLGKGNITKVNGVPQRKVLCSWDIEASPMVRRLQSIQLPCEWVFRQGDTGSPLSIEETDMIFFDTLHTHEHLSKELKHHGHKARWFLAFHDTFTCGERDVSGPNPNVRGILPAIYDYVGKSWKCVYKTDWSNGLMIYERC
jgi:hypothetical protein